MLGATYSPRRSWKIFTPFDCLGTDLHLSFIAAYGDKPHSCAAEGGNRWTEGSAICGANLHSKLAAAHVTGGADGSSARIGFGTRESDGGHPDQKPDRLSLVFH